MEHQLHSGNWCSIFIIENLSGIYKNKKALTQRIKRQTRT